MPIPRKHHSVPQFILRNFSIGDKERQVYAFDKSDRRAFPLSIRDAAAEHAFYDVEIDGQTVNFEPAFQAIDDLGAEVLGALARATSPVVLDIRALEALPALAAAQLLRTKLQRTSPQSIARQLRDQAADVGLDVEGEVTDEDARRISLGGLMDSAATEAAFRNKDVLVLEASQELRFWISDNPVVMQNTFPYGDLGISAPGIELYWPISSNRVVAFFCPSIGRQIGQSLDPKHLRPRLQNRLYPEMLRAIRDHSTLMVPDDYVAFLNELQVKQSTRFVYSGTDKFDSARTVLQRLPELSSVESLLTVGKMGAAPPRRGGMPAGEWLVVTSETNHHAIPVRTVEGGSAAYIEFEPLDHINLAVAMEDAPFDSAILYQDGFEVRAMREVEFTLLERDGVGIVRVTHSDPGLRSLMERLTGRGPLRDGDARA
jgi:hypothetical protein